MCDLPSTSGKPPRPRCPALHRKRWQREWINRSTALCLSSSVLKGRQKHESAKKHYGLFQQKVVDRNKVIVHLHNHPYFVLVHTNSGWREYFACSLQIRIIEILLYFWNRFFVFRLGCHLGLLLMFGSSAGAKLIFKWGYLVWLWINKQLCSTGCRMIDQWCVASIMPRLSRSSSSTSYKVKAGMETIKWVCHTMLLRATVNKRNLIMRVVWLVGALYQETISRQRMNIRR